MARAVDVAGHHHVPASAIPAMRASGYYFRGLALLALLAFPVAVALVWLRLYVWLWPLWGLCLFRAHVLATRLRAAWPQPEESH